ncbi:O-acyltransferase like protein-like [Watersipora subatra]|uniref:O-acyltransferase like protein-like n=1 Tax=Watersipora subatra TaxID=2589382 RepID=UPI00355B4DF3
MKLPDSIKVPSQPGKTLYLRMGLCFPSSCGASDVKLIMANLNVMGFMLPEVIESRCHADAPGSTGKFKTDALAITASAVMGALVLLVVICSIIDGICWYTPEDGLTWFSNRHEPKMIVNIQGQSNKVMELTDLSKPNSYENVTNEQIANGNGLVHKDPGIEMPQTMTVETVMIVAPAPDSLVKKLIQTFSLYKNVTALFQTKQPKGAVRSLDALRVFNMNWIILGHTYSMGAAFMQETLSNAKLAVEKVKDYTFMGVYSGMLAVDSYFFISGLLVSYLFLKTSAKNKGRWGPQLLIYYIHRLWRILPLYGILILVYAAFGQYLGSGPLFDWQSERVRDCNNNWWANLLFINNFYKPREMCLGWSWYLSNDMQFYVIAPIILIPLFLNAIAGGIIIGICFVAHWAVTAILWWRTDGQSYMQDPNIYYEAYITPYCRIGPYLVGLMLGYIFYKDYKLKQKLVAIVLWIVTIFLMGVVVYGQYGDVKDYGVTKPGWNRVQRTFYETFSRDVWGLCMAWIVYACNQGYAGKISTFTGFIGHILNWKGWTPLGRMTFATYLVHPIVIFIYVGNRRDLNHVDDFSVAFLYSGYVLLAYVSGAILSMIFEAPPAGLDRIVTKSLNGK